MYAYHQSCHLDHLVGPLGPPGQPCITSTTLTDQTTLTILTDQWLMKKIIAKFALFVWSYWYIWLPLRWSEAFQKLLFLQKIHIRTYLKRALTMLTFRLTSLFSFLSGLWNSETVKQQYLLLRADRLNQLVRGRNWVEWEQQWQLFKKLSQHFLSKHDNCIVSKEHYHSQ